MKGLVIALALVVVLAGCVSDVNVDSTNGVIVNEFSADPGVAEADDAVRVLLDVENVGGTTARCVSAELYGVDSWRDEFGVSLSKLYPGFLVPGGGAYIPIGLGRGLTFNYFGGNFNVCYSDYKNAGGSGPVGQVCVTHVQGETGLSGFIGDSFIDFSNQYCTALASYDPNLKLVKFQPELSPPQPSINRPGQSETFEWILRPPVLPEGVSATYPITARTSYFYSTNAVMNVQAFNKAEYKRRADLGQQVDYPLVVENSFGTPLQIFASKGSSPVIVNTDSMQYTGPIQYESYKFEFANLGEGFPLPMSSVDMPGEIGPQTESGFVIAVLSVRGPGVAFSDCLGQNGQDIFIYPSAIGNLVKVRSDQRVPIGCTIGIDKTQWAATPVGTISFTFSLNYRYYVDRTVNVQVVGVEGLTGPQAVNVI